MKSLKLISALAMLIVSSCSAQTKNLKVETVHISGNCRMCKNTIEKAGNRKTEATVDWDKDTKIATLKYDSLKTSKSEILKRIALVGYDNEAFLAPDDTYAGLAACCQYQRDKREDMSIPKAVTVHNHSNHNMEDMRQSTPSEDSTVFPQGQGQTAGLTMVFENYFKLKDALVQSNQREAATGAAALLNSIETVNMSELEMDVHMVWMKVLNDIKQDATTISTSDSIERQRKAFISLSEKMYQLAKVISVENSIYLQHCPMANDGEGANWLSREKEVKNPYYGSMMLSCGKVVETIK